MTSLCAIPGCRIVGRHLPDCEGDCRGCLPRITDEGLVCDVCTGSAGSRLAHIVQLTPDARLVAAGLVRRGSGGGGSGKPGSRSPGNDDAQDALDEIQNALTTIARDIAETRGAQFVSTAFAGLQGPDPLSEAAKWLTRQLMWLKHAVDDQGGPYAALVFAEIRNCASRMRGMLDGPSDKKFFGKCGSEVGWDDDGQEFERDEPCPGDVYGRPDAEEATCRACKARWGTAPRAEELGDKVREHAFSAKWIHEAYPKINLKTLRSWANRGQLKTYWRTEGDLTVEWIEPAVGPKLNGDELAEREAEVAAEIKARGPRLHYVGEVLDLAAADAARREEARATRARRMGQRSGEEAA